MPLLNLISCKTKWLGTNKGSPTIKSLYSAYQYSYQGKYLYLLCRANSHFKNSILVELLDHSLLAYSPDVLNVDMLLALAFLTASLTTSGSPFQSLSWQVRTLVYWKQCFRRWNWTRIRISPQLSLWTSLRKKIHKIIFMYINVELVELAGLTSSILNHPVWPVP